MPKESRPMVPAPRGEPPSRLLASLLPLVIRGSLLVSPRPAALLVRRVFADSGAKLAESLRRHAPDDVTSLTDQRYGDEPDMVLDVFRPAGAVERLPLVMWVHGGGFVGGSKEELAGYFKIIAHAGYTVAAPRYSLAPEHHYPKPPRQVMTALHYLQAHADQMLIDPDRIAIAGDSAGAHIAAQIATSVTSPGYDALGVEPSITPAQLRCVVLACGPYDLELARQPSGPAGALFMKVVLWAYTGNRRFFDDPASADWSIPAHVNDAFPPALITVGNADPLSLHSELLASTLRQHGVHVKTAFYPSDHQPPLGHEYQFDLDTIAGQQFLEWLVTFLHERLVQP